MDNCPFESAFLCLSLALCWLSQVEPCLIACLAKLPKSAYFELPKSAYFEKRFLSEVLVENYFLRVAVFVWLIKLISTFANIRAAICAWLRFQNASGEKPIFLASENSFCNYSEAIIFFL